MLPNALMIGVNYELFWTLNPKTLAPFVKAFSLKQNYDDAVCWRTGMYISVAIASNFDKGTKYPKKPLSSDKVERVNTPEDIKSKMMNTVIMLNSRFGKEQ